MTGMYLTGGQLAAAQDNAARVRSVIPIPTPAMLFHRHVACITTNTPSHPNTLLLLPLCPIPSSLLATILRSAICTSVTK